MTRHFFAFLALLTGLAAFGTPAEASLAEVLACDASIAASASDDAARSEQGHFALGESLPANPRGALASTPAPSVSAGSASLRLPVLMGIERAYE
ncbi:MAG: hypothetical protein ACK4IS_04135 [Erythrobacter sp.]